MQELISEICANYIGTQYSKLLTTLYSKPLTLQALIEVSQESYKHLLEKIKYLVNLDIISFEKSVTKGVIYSINLNNILFFQRVVKYYEYVEGNCSKQEIKILNHYFEVKTSSFEGYLKGVGVKAEQVERVKQVFVGLVKAGYLYEDEKALDLQLCERREDDVLEKPLMVESEEKEVEAKESPKAGKGSKKSTKEKDSSVGKGKKKQEIKLTKVDEPLAQTNPVFEKNITSKVENNKTYFSISLSFILSKIKDELIAARLRSKFNVNKPIKTLVQVINQQKYQAPFDIYNSLALSSKTNLLKDIHTELIEQYIFIRFGRSSLLVYKTLVDSGYITEKSLLKYTLLELKELRSSINLLYVSGILKSVEVKIERANTMVYWIDEEAAKKEYFCFLSKTCLNLDIIINRYKKEMHKQENQGFRISEIQSKLCRLEANLLEIDDCLILYNP